MNQGRLPLSYLPALASNITQSAFGARVLVENGRKGVCCSVDRGAAAAPDVILKQVITSINLDVGLFRLR